MAVLKKIYKTASFLAAFISSLILTSCFQDFEPDIESTPVVCINSLATAGEVLEVTVSRTWRWSEGNPDMIDIYLKDAVVKVFVNDEFREQLNYTEEKYSERPDYDFSDPGRILKFYRGFYIPQPGDHIRITADDPTYGHAEGEVTVPWPVNIEKADISAYNVKSERISSNEADIIKATGEASLSVWFSDPADTDNYYEFDNSSTLEMTSSLLNCRYNFDFSVEPIFTEHVSPLESIISETSGYYFFTDRQIAGKQYPLHIRMNRIYYTYLADEGPGSNSSTIDLILYSISESYWKHVISVWESNDGINGILGDVGLSDQIWESSNVSTGAGVIAARARSQYKIKYSDLLDLTGNSQK